MVEQLQQEIQQDMHNHHQTSSTNQVALSTKLDHCGKMMERLSTSMENLKASVSQQASELSQRILVLEKKIEDGFSTTHSFLSQSRTLTDHRVITATASASATASPSVSASVQPPGTMKYDHMEVIN